MNVQPDGTRTLSRKDAATGAVERPGVPERSSSLASTLATHSVPKLSPTTPQQTSFKATVEDASEETDEDSSVEEESLFPLIRCDSRNSAELFFTDPLGMLNKDKAAELTGLDKMRREALMLIIALHS